MPCDRAILNLLSQVGHLAGASTLTAQVYRVNSRRGRPKDGCWLKTGCDITRTAGNQCYTTNRYLCKGEILKDSACVGTVFIPFGPNIDASGLEVPLAGSLHCGQNYSLASDARHISAIFSAAKVIANLAL